MPGLSHWTNWALDGIISPAVKRLMAEPPEIQSYRFGQMVVDGKTDIRQLARGSPDGRGVSPDLLND
jgi:hypothetical protein